QWNGRGLGGKWDLCKKWIGNTAALFTVVNETRHTPGTRLKVNQYVTHTVLGSGGWGTAMFIYHRMSAHVLFKSLSTDPMEVIMVRVCWEGKPVTLVGSYWPPQYAPTVPEWRQILSNGEGPYVWLGDFNAHHMEGWGSHYTNQKGKTLMALMDEF